MRWVDRVGGYSVAGLSSFHVGQGPQGVVVAALLVALGVPDGLIVEDFLLSDDVEVANIRHALAGLHAEGELVDPERLRRRIALARAVGDGALG